jgi:hypothetical protein
MTPGSLSFAAKDWLWPVAALFFVGLVLIVWSYRRTSLSRGLREIEQRILELKARKPQ